MRRTSGYCYATPEAMSRATIRPPARAYSDQSDDQVRRRPDVPPATILLQPSGAGVIMSGRHQVRDCVHATQRSVRPPYDCRADRGCPRRRPRGGRNGSMRGSLKTLLPIVLVLQVAAEANHASMQNEPLDFSCAAFPGDLSEADLIARYGTMNVVSAPVFGSDDGPRDGTAVFPDRDDMKLEIVWWDPESKTKAHWIRARGAGSRWRTPHGITVGMDLLTIERANGWPFRLAALSTEGQGVIRSWGNGRFKDPHSGGCTLRISVSPIGGQNVEPSLARQVSRGREFSSGHPAMQALNPRVVSIFVTHSPR
jgi:hypothetical protein